MITIKELKSKYRYAVAYSKYMGSNNLYLEEQLWRAKQFDAPDNFVSFKETPFGLEILTTCNFNDYQLRGIKYYLK